MDRGVAALFAARASQEAVKLNRLRDYRGAVKELRAVGDWIRNYAGTDPELNALADKLRVDEAQWSAPAPEMSRKAAYASASSQMRNRSFDGRAEK